MLVDVVLILLTLVVAIIGVYSNAEKPASAPNAESRNQKPNWLQAWFQKNPRRAELVAAYRQHGSRVLIWILIATSAASLFKAWDDNSDKEFLQQAVTSTLVPTHSAYDGFDKEIDIVAAKEEYASACYHSNDGAACLLTGKDGVKRGTLVLDKGEVARLYENQLRSWWKKDGGLIQGLFKKKFNTSELSQELLNKAGIVGIFVYYEKNHEFPKNYYYDKRYGTILKWDGGEAVICPQDFERITEKQDFKRITEKEGLQVFWEIEKLFRDRINTGKSPCKFGPTKSEGR